MMDFCRHDVLVRVDDYIILVIPRYDNRELFYYHPDCFPQCFSEALLEEVWRDRCVVLSMFCFTVIDPFDARCTLCKKSLLQMV
jgi:hypothetical protein